jgi:hypothetical protein
MIWLGVILTVAVLLGYQRTMKHFERHLPRL